MEFNILTEAFITNLTVSGTQKVLTVGEVSALLAASGTAYTLVSGATSKVLMDLGAQKSVESLQYEFSPISVSGVTIRYGRDLEDLTTGSPFIQAGKVVLEPTASGFTYPRYFELTHTNSGSSLSILSLSVINTDEEIEFGEVPSGIIESVTLVGEAIGGYSSVVEVPVINSGIIPTDIFVSVDTAFTDLSLFSNFEIATTSTGVFKSFEESLTFPDSIPFEWGIFSNTTVVDDELKISSDEIFPDFVEDTEKVLTAETLSLATNLTHTEPCIDANGNYVFARIRTDHRIELVDPIRNIRFISSSGSYTVSGTEEQNHTHMAWDHNDTIYFLNGKSTRQIQKYTISTNTMSLFTTVSGFFNRRSRPTAYHDGHLYIGGALSTSGTASSVGSQFWRVKISDQTETQLTDLPEAPVAAGGERFAVLGDYIYYTNGGTTGSFYRYDINMASWEILENHAQTAVRQITPDVTNNRILLLNNNGLVIQFNVFTAAWSSFFTTDLNVTTAGAIGLQDTVFYYVRNFGGTIGTRARFLDSNVPLPNLGITSSGTWTSPVIKLESDGQFHRMLFFLNEESGSEMKFDDSLGVDTFQIRGSDQSPSAESSIERFEEELDDSVFLTSTLSENSIVTASGGTLYLSHSGVVDEFNSALVYFGLPFNTTGKMQYKFWWNPPSNKLAGSSHFSAFYIVPFLNTLDEGILPNRDVNTLRRTEDNYIYLRFGQNSDSGGTFSRLQFYNGSTVQSVTISAITGNFYEVILLIDWETGDYSIYFDTELVATGTIPQLRISLIGTQHSYEIFSAGEDLNFQEEYRELTINRVGNEVTDDTVLAVPLHREDPLYGINGTLTWTPITVNSPLIPKTTYVQFRLTFRSTGGEDVGLLENIKFIPIIRLEDVEPGESKSVYVRYNFPAANNLSTNTISLKAWMRTDKL